MMNLLLSAEEVVSLLMEMPIEREELRICPDFSFLAIMALLEQKMTKKESSNDRKRSL